MTEEMTAQEYMDSGDDWTSRIARLTLPILIWVAKQGKTITYKQLASELESRLSALQSKTPMQAMRGWYDSHSHLFLRRPYDRQGLDS